LVSKRRESDRGDGDVFLDRVVGEELGFAAAEHAQGDDRGREDGGGAKECLFELVVEGEDGGDAGAEGEEDAGDEVVDVPTADRDVAEGAAATADAVGGEADEGEGAEEARQEVEEDGLRARRGGVAADRDLDGLDRRARRRFDQRLPLLVDGGTAAEQAAELVGDDGARGTDGDRGEPDRRSLGASPAGPAPERSD
jgi:hypothetical protein